jgi:hypothetical protein
MNPDIAPSASINHWIVSILTFHFTLIHIAGTHHGPNGLSCRPLQDEDLVIDDEEDFGDWIDQLHGFMHQINPISIPLSPTPQSLPTFALSSDLSKGEDVSYDDVPHTKNSKKDDERLLRVQQWLDDMAQPSNLSDSEYATFMRYCTEFFLDSGRLWRKDSHSAHKIVPILESRLEIIRAAHNDIGHKMIFATKSLIALRFWWLNMKADIAWYIHTCHLCQLRQTRNLLIPPTVTTPAPLFAKVYIDMMHMPVLGGYRYIVQG